MTDNKKTYFISGHSDVTKSEFAEFYAPKILNAIEENSNFVVGDFIGLDTMAIEFLHNFIEKNPSMNFSAKKVSIFHKNDSADCNTFNFKKKGGYKGIEDRDIAMTNASQADILWIRDGKANSYTANNFRRRAKNKKTPNL